jgi:hypothetical protein
MSRDKRHLAITDPVDELDPALNNVTVDRINEISRPDILVNRLHHVDPALVKRYEELVWRKRKDQGSIVVL